jgi:hypothetical protein
MEQATIDTPFAHKKHYSCFTALDASMNNAFKVSTSPAIQGWHAGMCVIVILNQLSTIYGQPTLSMLETKTPCFIASSWWPTFL